MFCLDVCCMFDLCLAFTSGVRVYKYIMYIYLFYFVYYYLSRKQTCIYSGRLEEQMLLIVERYITFDSSHFQPTCTMLRFRSNTTDVTGCKLFPDLKVKVSFVCVCVRARVHARACMCVHTCESLFFVCLFVCLFVCVCSIHCHDFFCLV
jgi:hypothetical protein